MDYGYVRVSAVDQNIARQMLEMKDRGLAKKNIYVDKQSGKDFNRPQYVALVKKLKKGDLLYIKSIDRLGRNYNEILEQWRILTKEKGIDIVVQDMPLLDTRQHRDLTGALISDIVLQLLSYVAHNEREKIKARQAEGIAAAKERGVYKGRKPVEVDREQFAKLYQEVKAGARTNQYAMDQLGLKRNTYYKLIKEYESGTGRFKQ